MVWIYRSNNGEFERDNKTRAEKEFEIELNSLELIDNGILSNKNNQIENTPIQLYEKELSLAY